ncbi:MAG TPA: response regulator transcription factor, partial [Phototrophicaceae bacterium]|nr:response regulator transcription factor [Phototrophicaceae bacterium]
MTTTPPAAGGPIRVALVDDQQLVRAGFALVINSQPDMEVVVEASDGAQALRMLESYAADVVLMDVRMAGMDGLTATERLTATGTGPKVVILTTFDLDEYVMRAIKAGASGFLLKDVPPEDMLHAIRTVHAGD